MTNFSKTRLMSMENFIDTYQQIQHTILEFIEDKEYPKDKYPEFRKALANDISREKDIKNIILLLSSISDNHHRDSEFFTKIMEIMQSIKDQIKNCFSNLEIFNYFKNNKRTILLLINEKYTQSR